MTPIKVKSSSFPLTIIIKAIQRKISTQCLIILKISKMIQGISSSDLFKSHKVKKGNYFTILPEAITLSIFIVEIGINTTHDHP